MWFYYVILCELLKKKYPWTLRGQEPGPFWQWRSSSHLKIIDLLGTLSPLINQTSQNQGFSFSLYLYWIDALGPPQYAGPLGM